MTHTDRTGQDTRTDITGPGAGHFMAANKSQIINLQDFQQSRYFHGLV